ncbi:MAG: hypothetical protein MUF25_25185, partial [Pirellulaceae bacterium]|nr:hypothetical protein [Pirellulaceae bacterium]
VLHDLSPAMSGACEQALPGVSHFVCHQHLARDVGEDLYEAPQAALCQRLRTLKLQYRFPPNTGTNCGNRRNYRRTNSRP